MIAVVTLREVTNLIVAFGSVLVGKPLISRSLGRWTVFVVAPRSLLFTVASVKIALTEDWPILVELVVAGWDWTDELAKYRQQRSSANRRIERAWKTRISLRTAASGSLLRFSGYTDSLIRGAPCAITKTQEDRDMAQLKTTLLAVLVCIATMSLVSGCGSKEKPADTPASQTGDTGDAAAQAEAVAAKAQAESEALDAAAEAVVQKAVQEAAAAKAKADAEAMARKAAAEVAAQKAAQEAAAATAAEEARKAAAAIQAAALKAAQGKYDGALAVINTYIASGDYPAALKGIQDTLSLSNLSNPQQSTLNTLMGTVKEKMAAAALKEAGVDEATQKAATGAAKALGGLLNK